jgi:hypothetical protein
MDHSSISPSGPPGRKRSARSWQASTSERSRSGGGKRFDSFKCRELKPWPQPPPVKTVHSQPPHSPVSGIPTPGKLPPEGATAPVWFGKDSFLTLPAPDPRPCQSVASPNIFGGCARWGSRRPPNPLKGASPPRPSRGAGGGHLRTCANSYPRAFRPLGALPPNPRSFSHWVKGHYPRQWRVPQRGLRPAATPRRKPL